ncbi:hypothetical protein [Hymenobacter sp. B81]|uniref:hypothetical protein n=1 Tax=Hymenobacter sp. B81 TaxID=3344878 RepID=UPI0037DCDA43
MPNLSDLTRRLAAPAGGLLLGLTATLPARAQGDYARALSQQFTQYQQQHLQEKLFLHLDRPSYVSGETLWFKAYAVDGTRHRPLPLSSVAYVEVLDGAGRALLQTKVALRAATGQGSLVLPATLPSGTYRVRAYTNWMKNAGPDYFFQAPVTVINTLLSLNAPAPAAADSAGYDVQLLPEGGQLVQGLASTVAVKATDHHGRGLAAAGEVLDGAGRVVARFGTSRLGMARFALTPAPGAAYRAVLRLPDGRRTEQRLPTAQAQGFVLHLDDTDPNQLKLTVAANVAGGRPEGLLLLGHTRQQLFASASTWLTDGRAVFFVDRSQLPEGVAHFTLFNADRQPLAERLYFRAPQRRLLVAAAADQTRYGARQKVRLRLATTDQNRQPVPANLSLAVYRVDSLSSVAPADISTFLGLTSDLRGRIEQPEYYLTAPAAEAREALDNLMLTQGWRRFRWSEVLAATPAAPAFVPELNGHLVQGRVLHRRTGQPAEGVATYLATPGRLVRLYNAVSKADGLVRYEMKDFYGPKDLVLQTNQLRDSLYRFELLSPFATGRAAYRLPAFSPAAGQRAELTERHLQAQVQQAYFRKYRNRYLVPASDSLAFYGKPDAAYMLDDYTRFKVLEEVMREYVPGVLVRRRKDGFHFQVLDLPNKGTFTDDPMVLLDGVPVFDLNKLMAVDPLRIRRLEVVNSRYFHGELTYSGLLSYTTYRGDLEEFSLDERALVQDYEGLQLQREFYAPRYDTPEQQQSRLPDLRNLLYWNPNVNTTAGPEQALEFFTSDQAGTYRVVVQGLTPTGLPGSTSFTFEVTGAL